MAISTRSVPSNPSHSSRTMTMIDAACIASSQSLGARISIRKRMTNNKYAAAHEAISGSAIILCCNTTGTPTISQTRTPAIVSRRDCMDERMPHVREQTNRPKVMLRDGGPTAHARRRKMFDIVRMLMMIIAALLTAEQTFLAAVKDRDADTVRSMLAAQPSLATAKNEKGNSAVMLALFALRKGDESFPDPATNATLQAILERKPPLDIYETAAVGTPQQLEAMLRESPDALKRPTGFGWTLLHLAAFGGNS